MMKSTVMHFAGALRWMNKNGAVTSILAGWAACCSGDAAQRIRDEGRHTVYAPHVTCKVCLKVMAKAESMKCCEHAITNPGPCMLIGCAKHSNVAPAAWDTKGASR